MGSLHRVICFYLDFFKLLQLINRLINTNTLLALNTIEANCTWSFWVWYANRFFSSALIFSSFVMNRSSTNSTFFLVFSSAFTFFGAGRFLCLFSPRGSLMRSIIALVFKQKKQFKGILLLYVFVVFDPLDEGCCGCFSETSSQARIFEWERLTVGGLFSWELTSMFSFVFSWRLFGRPVLSGLNLAR